MKCKIKIGAHKYSVNDECPDHSYGENWMGRYIPKDNQIKINGTMPKSKIKETMLHEIMHGFADVCGVLGDREEQIIENMSAMLYMFITDNKKFMQEYFLDD